jgi:hypothetical protein
LSKEDTVYTIDITVGQFKQLPAILQQAVGKAVIRQLPEVIRDKTFGIHMLRVIRKHEQTKQQILNTACTIVFNQ